MGLIKSENKIEKKKLIDILIRNAVASISNRKKSRESTRDKMNNRIENIDRIKREREKARASKCCCAVLSTSPSRAGWIGSR